jgi:hypothetical protein
MPIRCPILSKTLVIADDARLAAQASCVLAQAGTYLPIIDGPRMMRPDSHAEVIRRSNAAGRAKPDRIILTGISDEAYDAMMHGFAPGLRGHMHRITDRAEIETLLLDKSSLRQPRLTWGCDRIGVGVIKALRARSGIVFSDEPSPIEPVAPKTDHLVICEEGDELAQVIAANYAFSLGAGLHLIPAIDDPAAEDILERFYSVMDQQRMSHSAALEELKALLRARGGHIVIPAGGSLSFIARHLPYGFGFPEVPSTHLFSYPDLGIAILNGFVAEQPGAPGVGVAVLVDPGTTKAPDIEAAVKLLPQRGMLVRAYEADAANVRAVTDMIELFPFDFLLIATHCGDAPGFRWTYEFIDTEGIARTLVVDIAVGFGATGDRDIVDLTQFMHFISLDGVDWRDPVAKQRHYIGTAMNDFMARVASDASDPLKPVKKENIPRVTGSAALQMHDHNYISVPRAIAAQGTPIVINNACSSWHRLAGDYTFGNARAYIGTLFPVTGAEAHDVVAKLLDKHFGKPLAAALWSAQREVYGDSVRRGRISQLAFSRNDCVPCAATFPPMLLDACRARYGNGRPTLRKPERVLNAPRRAWRVSSATTNASLATPASDGRTCLSSKLRCASSKRRFIAQLTEATKAAMISTRAKFHAQKPHCRSRRALRRSTRLPLVSILQSD